MLRRHIVARSVVGFVVFAFCLPLSAAGWAQVSSTATISGTVRDPSGAPIPGASVTITSEDTGRSISTESNVDGSFVAAELPVETYRVTAVKTGFQTHVEEHIILHPTVVTAVTIVLQVGQVTTHVTVAATAAQVQTATPEVSGEISQTQVQIFPMNGRNFQSLASLMPGVTNTSPDTALTPGGFLQTNTMTVNGMGTNGSQYFVDGIWNENTGDMTQLTITPNPDTLQEVRVLQNNFSVQYSLNGASVVMLETKSGTSRFHGSFFEYLRNDALDARNFFAPTVPPLKQNIFGYTLGGPVYIPGHYNTDKSKTFFFWSQQWTRQNAGSAVLGADPTPAMRGGDFGSLCTTGFNASGICSTASEQLTNPATGQPFPNNVITTPLNPNALLLLNALAPPPNNGTGFLNYINLNPTINDTRDDEIRVDHNFTEKLRLMAEYLDDFQTNGNSYDNFLASPYATTRDPIITRNRLAQIRLTASLSPNMVNTTSVSMNNYVANLGVAGIWQTSQIPGFSEILPYPNATAAYRIPEVDFAGGYGSIGLTYTLPLPHAGDLEDTLSDDWSWLRGKHFIQAGENLVLGIKRQSDYAATNGDWFFSGQFTGNPIADYLLGDAATFTQATAEPRNYLPYRIFSPYVQDRWKVTPRLTITAGLRVEFEPFVNLQPRFGSLFDPNDYNPANAPIVNPNGTITPTATYNPLNGLIINGENGIPLNFTNRHEWYVDPSVGFAYDVFGDGKTALRGGYQMTTQNTFFSQGGCGQASQNFPFVDSLTLITPTFPNPIGAAVAPPGAPSFCGIDVRSVRGPAYTNFSLTLEHQFARNWLVSVAGAGSTGRHLPSQWNINQALPDPPYNFNPIINSETVFPYVYSPYQGYGAIEYVETNDNSSWYALEVNVRHPMGHDVFLNVAYTWQHGLGDASVAGNTGGVNLSVGGNGISQEGAYPQNIYRPGNSYGTEAFNVPQVLTTSLIWGLPWYRNAAGLKKQALGGWQFADVTTIQNGFALTPGLATSNPGIATYPDRIASSVQGPRTASEWFNTSAFASPAAGYFGNAAPGSIPGPGVVNFDMALYKDFVIKENVKFQFRAEAFNIFNHTNFSSVSTLYGSGSYGQVISALDPRIMEFALRFQF